MYLSIIIILIFSLFECRPHNKAFSEASYRKLTETTLDSEVVKNLSWEPIRIQFEYLSAPSDQDKTFLDQVFLICQNFMSRYLLVRRTATTMTFKSDYPTNWSGIVIPTELQNKIYEADYVFFVNCENDSSVRYLAYAGMAIFDEITKRPKMGLISWNMFFTDLAGMTDAKFEAALETAIHEMIHGLGFVSDYFGIYYDSSTAKAYTDENFSLQSVMHLKTPRIVKQTQRHFNCSTLTGLQMENEGGEGTAKTHFERALLYNEIMTGSDMTGDIVFTDFTFELLQDTGFYRITNYEPDILSWGMNQGCDFVQSYCEGGNFKEYCTTKGEDGCSFARSGLGSCGTDSLANSCNYIQIYTNYDCRDATMTGLSNAESYLQYFGYNSMCVEGYLSKQSGITNFPYSCYQYQCDENYQLTLIVDGHSFKCTTSGPVTIPEGYVGNLQCPENPSSYCIYANECPNQCNRKGFCLKGKCNCQVGYSGLGCEIPCSTYRNGIQCVETCPDGTYANDQDKQCLGCPGHCSECSNYNRCSKCINGYALRGDFCDNFTSTTEPDGIDLSSQNNSTDNSTAGTSSSATSSSNSTTNSTSTTDGQSNTSASTSSYKWQMSILGISLIILL